MVSPLGVGVRKCWAELLASKSGIGRLKDEHSFPGYQSQVAAYVPEDQLQKELEESKHSYMMKNAKQLSRATKFAMLAAHEALEEARLLDDSQQQVKEELRLRCGVAIGQGMVDFEDIYQNGSLIRNHSTKATGFRKMSPFFMTRILMNMSAGNVGIRYKLHGPNHCVSTACATGAHSLGDAFNLIRCNQADIMLCGSTEASINDIAMAGFERLRALCTKFNDDPAKSSRPFDKDRAGFVMGEGSGVLVLESLDHARARGVKENEIYCEILGYGLSSDAYHLTSPAPDGLGAKNCMKSALSQALLEPSAIGHINAHATSTPLGDDIESNAIEELFLLDDTEKAQQQLTVTSCKGSIGHLLGGAGSVESIFAILTCKEGSMPPTLNLEQPLDTPKNLIKFVRDAPQRWSQEKRILLKNSFGFGGTNASIVISNFP